MQKNVILKMGLQSVLLLLVMLYGMMLMKFELPPYSLLKDASNAFLSKKYNVTPKEYTEVDVAALVSIRQSQDVFKLRSELSHFLWGSPTLPQSFPATININKSPTDARYKDIASLRNIEKLVVTMEFGLESHVYHFTPKEPNNKVILYHHGHHYYNDIHGGDFYLAKKQIKEFLDNGYSVVAFTMPLVGLNNRPTVQIPAIGAVKLVKHDQLIFLNPRQGHPIKYFLEPVIMVINHLENNYDYSSISMVGISGGGWTTTLVAALDTRIKKSFSVAGSYPLYLRLNSPQDLGGIIQDYPELYQTVNYLELYVLAAYGEGRKHLQVINKYDPCCFSGVKWETYKDIIKTRVHQLGEGEYDLFLDDSHRQHTTSVFAMQRILHELNSHP